MLIVIKIILSPLPVIKPLTKQFYRWLCTVGFLQWHRYVIDKNNPSFSNRWTVNTFAPSIKLAHYYFLSLIGRSLCGEVNKQRLINGRIIFFQ